MMAFRDTFIRVMPVMRVIRQGKKIRVGCEAGRSTEKLFLPGKEDIENLKIEDKFYSFN